MSVQDPMLPACGQIVCDWYHSGRDVPGLTEHQSKGDGNRLPRISSCDAHHIEDQAIPI